MIKTELVYCVECKEVMSRDNAEKIFKTGYYKTITPLCHCKDCANTDTNKLNVEIPSDSHQFYSGFEEVIMYSLTTGV